LRRIEGERLATSQLQRLQHNSLPLLQIYPLIVTGREGDRLLLVTDLDISDMDNLDVAEWGSSKSSAKAAKIKCRGCGCNIANILCTLTRRLRRTSSLFDADENCRVAFKTDRIIIVAKVAFIHYHQLRSI
jgi:hypothetical protein